MKKIAILLVSALCALPMSAATTQYNDVKADTVVGLRHYTFWDNWFIGVHAGANATLGENVRFGDVGDVIAPSFGLSVGKYFSPAVGARIQGMFNFQKGRAYDGDDYSSSAMPFDAGETYKFNNVAGYADVLFNLSNIFCQYKESRKFNVVGFIGVGGNHTFGFDDKVDKWSTGNGKYEVDTKDRTYFALRAGFQLGYQISKAFDLTLDLAANATDDGYNGVRYDDLYDGYATAMLGLVYHFKDKYGDNRFKYATLTDADQVSALNNKINDARSELANIKPKVETKTEYTYHDVLQMTVSFIIDKYNITDIQKKNVAEAAKYLQNHPDVNLVVCGYADVKTAYPAYNLKLSERRANAVYNMLVKNFKVDKSRLRIDYKGDTVQPYDLKNEWNRVVIFVTEPRNN